MKCVDVILKKEWTFQKYPLYEKLGMILLIVIFFIIPSQPNQHKFGGSIEGHCDSENKFVVFFPFSFHDFQVWMIHWKLFVNSFYVKVTVCFLNFLFKFQS